MGCFQVSEFSTTKQGRDLKSIARKSYAVRRKWNATPAGRVMADITWDILLFLYAYGDEDLGLSKGVLVEEMAKPNAAIERYLNLLTQQGLLVPHVDRLGCDAKTLTLTDVAQTYMEAALAAARGEFDTV